MFCVGRRCTKEGYYFVWSEGEEIKPVMITGGGTCTFLEVDGGIPYLLPGNIPDDEVVNRDKLVRHLESLIQKLRNAKDNVENCW